MRRTTELIDASEKLIHEGDVITFCGIKGKVIFQYGCFGVATEEEIDYLKLQKYMDDNEEECCGNEYRGCENDNFISLWELYWNFNCIENFLWIAKIVE